MTRTPTVEKWQAHVDAWHQSGLTRQEFADIHALNPSTLSWWKWKLAQDAPAEPEQCAEVVQLTFVEIENDDIRVQPAVAPAVELAVGAFELRLWDHFDAETLHRVLDVLEERR